MHDSADTDRKRIEDELAAARKRVAELEGFLSSDSATASHRQDTIPSFGPDLLHKSGVVFWMRNVESGVFESMSKTAVDCLGFTAEDLLQDAALLQERIDPRHQPAAWEYLNFDHPDELHEEEIRYVHPNGGVRWLQSHVQGGFDQTGKLTHTMGMLSDCTRSRNELELHTDHAAMLQSVLDSIHSAIFLLDTEGRYVFVNKHYTDLFGADTETLAGKTPVDIHDPKSAKEFIRTDKLILQTRQPHTAYDTLTVDGEQRVFLTTKSPVLDENESVVGICGVAMDVTEQKRTEDVLRETSELLNAIMEYSSSYIFIKDTRGTYVRVNCAYATALGKTQDEIEGKTDFDLYDRERALYYRKIDKDVLASQEPYTFECPVSVTDEKIQMLTTCFPLPDSHDNPAGVCVIATDVTDQHIAAEAIAHNERRFRAIINSVDRIAIQGYDDERRVMFWNPPSERLYGYTREEALGRLLEDLIIPDHMRDLVIEGHNQWVEHGLPIPAGELVLRDKNGNDVEVYSSHVMYETPDGRREMFCVDVDLTEVKRMERELIAARDAAETANRAKSEFLANMSHEIRTPLNGIMGMLQLLNADDLSGEQSHYLDIALTSCRNLTRLLSDILDLSRVEAGKMELVEEVFSINKILDTLRPTYGDQAMRKGIELRIYVEENFPGALVGDPIRLRQVLMNLVGNAVKFTEHGHVRVEIGGLMDKDGDSFRLVASVHDTGIGISREKIAHIFEPFTQLESAYQRKFQGAGLGLSIVKRLVQLMGGFLTMESEPNVGTTVQFSVPFKLAEPTSREETPPQTASRENMRLLVVEDEPVNRMTLTKLLEHEGFAVSAAAGGEEALNILAQTHVDLVLMDIQMAGMDGLEVTRRIRQGEVPGLDPKIPIIALTAYAMAGDRESFLKADMNDYLAKPVDVNDLRKVLQRFTKL